MGGIEDPSWVNMEGLSSLFSIIIENNPDGYYRAPCCQESNTKDFLKKEEPALWTN